MNLVRFWLSSGMGRVHLVFRWGELMPGGTPYSVLISVMDGGSLSESERAKLAPWYQSILERGAENCDGGLGALGLTIRQSKAFLPTGWKVEKVQVGLLEI